MHSRLSPNLPNSPSLGRIRTSPSPSILSKATTIDWDKLATEKRVVAIIHRATIGDRVDKKYAERKIEAKKRGYKWGAYHFGKPGDPIKQADFFLKRSSLNPTICWRSIWRAPTRRST